MKNPSKVDTKPVKISKRGRVNEGRPSKYTIELGDDICLRISRGESLLSICSAVEYPSTEAVYRWLLDDSMVEFHNKYAQARAIQAEVFFERLDDLALQANTDIVGGEDKADNARVQARRLQVDTLKWRLSKMLPKKYGDKLDLTSGGDKLPTPILQINQVKQVIHEQVLETPQDIPQVLDGSTEPQ